ncbi:AraC family transcriptional regulator [Ravibacter arvi]|uniref:AraC family transcriptional regulator n=1 Tax=Ravibacter arvi TaxID=2051041 RepID=A0ABP8LS84_9BACT
MKPVEFHLPQDFDKSFIVFREKGDFFPAPWHYHAHYEVVLVTQSTGKRMVGDNIGFFGPEDLVFLGSKLPHLWLNDKVYLDRQANRPADAIVIHFTDDFLGKDFMSIPEMQDFKKFLALSDRGMVINGNTRKEVSALMKQMPEMSGLERLSTLFQIFNLLAKTKEMELLASPRYVANLSCDVSNRFKNLINFIMQNFDKDITLADVAEYSHMGVTAFCNFFREQFRCTFVEYLTSVRIGHACKLLSESDRNVVEIAFESGFNNLANFNRQFKKLKNMTPSDYRKLYHGIARLPMHHYAS